MAMVLVVDDDTEIVNLIKTFLMTGQGHQVMSAANPFDAFELLDKYRFSLAIVDVNMPHQSGFEFVEQLRRSLRNRHLPVVFLTARSERKDIERARKLDIHGYMIKPIKKEPFIEKIGEILGRVPATPSYDAVEVIKDNLQGQLVITYAMQIETISEVFMTVLTPHDIGDLEGNHEKQIELQSNVWAHLGISPTGFKISGKHWADEFKKWRYTLTYLKLSPEDLDKLKKWVEKKNLS